MKIDMITLNIVWKQKKMIRNFIVISIFVIVLLYLILNWSDFVQGFANGVRAK